MYIPGFPGLRIKDLLSRAPRGAIKPFPLSAAWRDDFQVQYYYFARNGIYHALRYFGIAQGDEILMPELNSTIEYQAVKSLGAFPVMYQIDPDTYIPDWQDLTVKVSARTKFLHIIHYLGVPNAIEEARDFCERHHIRLFEDAAYGFLSSLGEKSLGSFGDFSILCPRKTIPVANGGLLIIPRKNINADSFPRQVFPFQSLYSSFWDWFYLLRNTPSLKFDMPEHGEGILSVAAHHAARTLKRPYIFHGDSNFKTEYRDWAMTPLAKKMLHSFNYTSLMSQIIKNYNFVRDFCLTRQWDIFPRAIPVGCVPNAILLRVPNASVSAVDEISAQMRLRGIAFARPWHWNENITTWKNVPSVDSYVGRGLILPIHYQLNEQHLLYYLNILDKMMKI